MISVGQTFVVAFTQNKHRHKKGSNSTRLAPFFFLDWEPYLVSISGLGNPKVIM